MKKVLLACIALLAFCSLKKETTPTPSGTPDLKLLLKHFKDVKTFPFIADSTLMNNLSKYDSLGGPEVKMLTQQWCKDSLFINENHNAIMQDFYTIDSLKAKHAYVEWCKKADIGVTEYGNAYAIGKIKLKNGAILLVWAFTTQSYPADPVSGRTNIYFTFYDGTNLGQTFMLGEELEWADPPSGSQTLFYGNLNNMGTLVLKETEISEDYDTMLAQNSYSHLIYNISPGKVERKANYNDSTATRKIKD